MKDHNYYVYIMTNDLVRRASEHKNGSSQGFTNVYRLNRLVYFEHSTDVNAAIRREKQLKKWNRSWKIELIEGKNPHWNDLYSTLI